MPIITVKSDIVADKPTINGNIYPKDVLVKIINSFNSRTRNRPSAGGYLNRDSIHEIGMRTHKTRKAFLDQNEVLCVEIEVPDNSPLLGLNIIARPIICVPQYALIQQKMDKGEPLVINDVYSIVRVQVENNDKP